MTPLEEARAFLAEATRGGRRAPRGNRGRGGNRGSRGGGNGGAPVTPPRAPATRGGRGGGGRGGSSLLQRAVSNATFQPGPAPATQETNRRHPEPPSTPSYTPQPRNTRPFAIPIVAPPSYHNNFTPPASPAHIGTSMFATQAPPNTAAPPTEPRVHTPVGRASTFRGRGRGRGRGGRPRYANQEEEDAVRAFYEDDTPAPVGEVCFYQEEYVKKGDNPSGTAVSSTPDPVKPTGDLMDSISGPKGTITNTSPKDSSDIKEAHAQNKTVTKASNGFEGMAPGKSVPAASKTVDTKEREQRLLRESKEREDQANRQAERKKQLNLLHKIEKEQVSAHTQQDVGTDDSVPHPVTNSTDNDLMDMDFEPTVTQYVAPPSQPSPFGFNGNQFPAMTGFPKANEEVEEEEL